MKTSGQLRNQGSWRFDLNTHCASHSIELFVAAKRHGRTNLVVHARDADKLQAVMGVRANALSQVGGAGDEGATDSWLAVDACFFGQKSAHRGKQPEDVATKKPIGDGLGKRLIGLTSYMIE